MMKGLSETLAGRVGLLDLYPMSIAEGPVSLRDYASRALRGSYPEALKVPVLLHLETDEEAHGVCGLLLRDRRTLCRHVVDLRPDMESIAATNELRRDSEYVAGRADAAF